MTELYEEKTICGKTDKWFDLSKIPTSFLPIWFLLISFIVLIKLPEFSLVSTLVYSSAICFGSAVTASTEDCASNKLIGFSAIEYINKRFIREGEYYLEKSMHFRNCEYGKDLLKILEEEDKWQYMN